MGNFARRGAVWFGLTAVFIQGIAFAAIPARFGASPDSSQQLLIDTFNLAKKSLTINIYEFDHEPILDALEQQIKNGRTVKLLLETEPVRGMARDGWQAAARLKKAMRAKPSSRSHVYLMGKHGGAKRRFRYNHAKYVVVDHRYVLLASENFTASGHPDPGNRGNRGWSIRLDDPELAREFEKMFQGDASTKYGDVTDPDVIRIPPDARPGRAREILTRAVDPVPSRDGQVEDVKLVTSPGSEDDIVSLIRSADDQIEAQQMSMPLNWRDPQTAEEKEAERKAKQKAKREGKNENEDEDEDEEDSSLKPNPVVLAWVKAAHHKGVRVRVLLNDDKVFDPPGKPREPNKRPNFVTARTLQAIAACKNWPIEARIVDINKVGITYIHNKGYLVDKRKMLLSSINGTQNSMHNNRETALLLTGQDPVKYYRALFDWDWERSPKFPKRNVDCTRISKVWLK